MFRLIFTVAGILGLILQLEGVETDSSFYKQFRREIGGWIAGDATYSVLLPDGRTLWLFGDTFIGEVDGNQAILPGSSLIRNSGVLQDGDSLRTLFGGNRSQPTDFISPGYPDSSWYWPEHGRVDGDTLRIFVAEYVEKAGSPSGFNFTLSGNYIANFTLPGLEFTGVVPVRAHSENQVVYGDRVLEYGNTIYLYGRRNDDPEVNMAYPHVARVEKGKFNKQEEWEYFNGTGWSGQAGDSKRIHSHPVSQQYCVWPHDGKFVLLTQDIWLSPKIWSFTSEAPEGPWENQKLVYTTPESGQDMFTYNAYAHPQFDKNAELLISYNTNGDFWSIFSNVEIYRPRFIRVPYMNLDYAFWPSGTPSGTGEAAHALKVYPNPATDFSALLICLEEPCTVTLKIVDLGGRILHEIPERRMDRGTQRLELDLSGLPDGFYLCHVNSGGRMVTLRLVKN